MRIIKSTPLLLSLLLLLAACNSQPAKDAKQAKGRLDLSVMKGIRYTEVKRRFSNGLSFDTMGFQQEPSWAIELKKPDTMLAYDPGQKKMEHFFLLYDHGNVYNFAREWFRFKLISKDSLVFQRLHLTRKEIADDIRSDVNMTFYSDSYIRDHLKTTSDILRRPSKADTLFIKEMVARANRNPTNADSVFAATQPVTLIPVDNRISVEKISNIDKFSGKTEAYDYLYPNYRIVIPHAYKDFAYEFNLLIDETGKARLGKFFMNMPEYRETRKKVLQGITEVYLQNLLKIKPGYTLGIPHATEITVNVTGRKGAK